MSVYILVHGAWHGSWCWDKIAPFLEKVGHQVQAPDLPGHGDDKTPIAEISLKAYADRVCDILDTQPEPVILVGHSMGGVVVTQAAEYRPDKVKILIYVAAFLLKNGEFLLQYAEQDKDSMVLPNLIMAQDQSFATLKEEAVKEVFYGDCSDEDIEKAKLLLVPQAVAPLATPVKTSQDNFGSLPRIYISCSRDRAISPPIQEKMCSNLPCEKVIQMDTSHSPYLSAPEELAKHLLSI
jgi:pimeloyl-ACP methyl ester carboxylesterase